VLREGRKIQLCSSGCSPTTVSWCARTVSRSGRRLPLPFRHGRCCDRRPAARQGEPWSAIRAQSVRERVSVSASSARRLKSERARYGIASTADRRGRGDLANDARRGRREFLPNGTSSVPTIRQRLSDATLTVILRVRGRRLALLNAETGRPDGAGIAAGRLGDARVIRPRPCKSSSSKKR